MRRFQVAFSATLAASLLASPAGAQRPGTPVPDPGKDKDYDWRKLAAGHGLQPEDVKRLDQSKLLVTNQAYKQIFTPYIAASLPVFVTSDTVLSGYHVLLEESVLRLERANAARLPEVLAFISKNLQTVDRDVKGKPELVAAAKARAQVVIAVARRLLGEEPAGLSPKLPPLVDAEVKRVTAAAGQAKPEWLGPPDRGFMALDYTRYRPRGFYTGSEALRRYFRAVSWLQSIPFRVEKDEELLAILMLGNALRYSPFGEANEYDKDKEFRTFFRCFRQFVGAGDDWDLMTAAHEAQNKLDLDLEGEYLRRKCKSLLEQAGGYGKGPQINDQLAFAPDDGSRAAEVAFRIIAPARTPDGVLFHRTTDLRKFRRPFPEGLEVCAALGSSLARSRLSGDGREELLATIDGCRVYFDGSSLYAAYLDCLRALLDEPEPDAPEFLRGEPWQIKSCQTALAGWAQMRHTWTLQAKQTAHWLCASIKPPGFVEPEPEFFSRFAALVRRTEETLRRAGAFETSPGAMAVEIRAVVDVCRRKNVAELGLRKILERGVTMDEWNLLHEADLLLNKLQIVLDLDDPKKITEALDKLEGLAAQLETGKMPENRELARVLTAMTMDVEPHWRRLGELCRRLEALAHKQLRKAPFSDEENRFLLRYGEELAGIMLYGGNSYVKPKDDAPRIVDVYANPSVGKVLEVGTARPRALYVLYPYKGGEVLCRGAVLPYYEFASERRLTDAEWKALLDGKGRPDIPAWVKPIVATGGIGIPERNRKE